MSIEFNPGFQLEELKDRVNNGYFDEEVYTYLVETLKEDSNDSKELMSGEISPCDFFELSIMEREKGWRSHYISSMEHGTVDKEIITLLKNRIDKLFDKAKADLGINKEIALEEEQRRENIDNAWGETINQLRIENGLEPIPNGSCHFIKVNINKSKKEILDNLKNIQRILEDADIGDYKKSDYIKSLDYVIMEMQRVEQSEHVKELLEKEANRAKENEKLIGIDPKSYLGEEILKQSREIINLRGEIREGLLEIKRRLK